MCETLSPMPDVRLARFMPLGTPSRTAFVWSRDRQLVVAVDGYIYVDGPPVESSLESQVRAFAEICRQDGFAAGMQAIAGGAFIITVVDIANGLCHISNDYAGSISLYYCPLPDGWLASTSPVALTRSGIIDMEPDPVAMAEWAYIGYTLGDRFMLKGIKQARLYSAVSWNSRSQSTTVSENADTPWKIEPTEEQPSVDELNDAFVESCRRISLLDPHPAQYQSAGKDSRMILAAWPEGYNPPCYTYGDVDSHEVALAREIAELRGSRWIHVWEDGDEIAPNIGRLFDATGLIIFPDRLIAARRIQQDGHRGVLDGFLGGIFIGSGYYDCDKYFSRVSRAARFLPYFVDQRVSRIGLERISEALYSSIAETQFDVLKDWLKDDFALILKDQKPCVLQDMYEEVVRWRPANDSLAWLWNTVIIANRSAHAIAQQAVISRAHIDVYTPFSSDRRFLRLQLRVRPERAAYDRLHIEMFRRRFPDYAKIPYGATLLPLRCSATRHKLSMMVMSRGRSIPGITGNTHGRERDANSWAKWMFQSQSLREAALELLREGGIIDESKCTRTLASIVSGQRRSTGKVFHLAAIAKWLAISGKKRSLT
jgi:asparagine synthetase B (glutamine-hydrolysing)